MTPLLQREVLGPTLALTLWSWAIHVFGPARQLKRLGLYRPLTLGRLPKPQPLRAVEPLLSSRYSEPVLLAEEPSHYESVSEFDHCADGYDDAVRPFSEPIFEETRALMDPFLTSSSRILDPSCGPGKTAARLARLVPDGEVVAADLSRGMVLQAHKNARPAGGNNMAFFQADVSDPPQAFESHFDIVFCCLSFHHYPDAEGAVRAFHRVLRPGGVVFIADGGPQWFVTLARGISKLTDPGFVRHRTGEEFMELFRTAGFEQRYWVEALPGIGVSIAQR